MYPTCHMSVPMCVISDKNLHVKPSSCLRFLKLGGVKCKFTVLCQILPIFSTFFVHVG